MVVRIRRKNIWWYWVCVCVDKEMDRFVVRSLILSSISEYSSNIYGRPNIALLYIRLKHRSERL